MKHRMILLALLILCLPVLCLAEELPGKIFDEPAAEYTVTEKDYTLIPVDFRGTPVMEIDHKAQSDKYFVYYLDERGIHVYPVAKGKATITLTSKRDKKDRTVITVNVEESAVYGKNEDAPLRAFVVLDAYEAVPGDPVTGRYVILGGSGKYPEVSVNGYSVGQSGDSAQMDPEHVKVQKGKGKGTVTVKACSEMEHAVYVSLSVVDSAGTRYMVQSNPVLFSPRTSIGAVCDTTFINVPAGREIRCRYYTYSDYPIKSGRLRCFPSGGGITEKKLRKIGGENELDLEPPDGAQDPLFILEITDSKNHTAGFRLGYSTAEDWYLALKCDRPVAAVGDEIHLTIESENAPASAVEELNPMFCCYRYTGKGRMFEFTILENVRRTPDGFTVACDGPGIIYLMDGAVFNTVAIIR